MGTNTISGTVNNVSVAQHQLPPETGAAQRESPLNRETSLGSLQQARGPAIALGSQEQLPQSRQASGVLTKCRQVLQDWKGSSGSFAKIPAPTDRAALLKLKEDSLLAAIPYTGRVPEDRFGSPPEPRYDTRASAVLAMKLEDKLKEDQGRGQVINQGAAAFSQIVDKNTGLIVDLVVDKQEREVKIVFGGTASGLEKSESRLQRNIANFRSNLSQWVTNFKTGVGMKAHSLEQAANITKHVVDLVKNEEHFTGYTVSTIGHSKGAAEAVYSALSQSEPLKAVGFASADLGGRLVRELPPENVERATELVTHYHVKADIVPNLRYCVPTMRPLGEEVVIPTSGSNGPFGRHSILHHHIGDYVSSNLANSAEPE